MHFIKCLFSVKLPLIEMHMAVHKKILSDPYSKSTVALSVLVNSYIYKENATFIIYAHFQ